MNINEKDIKGLEQLAVKLKTSQRAYRTYVIFFLFLAALTVYSGIRGTLAEGGSSSMIAYVIAAAAVYMAVDGMKMSARGSFRTAAKQVNHRKTLPCHDPEGLRIQFRNGRAAVCPWTALSMYLCTDHGLWLISTKDRKKTLVLYISPDFLTEDDYDEILENLASYGIPEEKI